MPVSKKRTKNSRPTQSKNISTQMSSGKGPSPRWYVVTMAAMMVIGVLLIVLNYLDAQKDLFESSGVLAFASGSGAIILQKNDGNKDQKCSCNMLFVNRIDCSNQ